MFERILMWFLGGVSWSLVVSFLWRYRWKKLATPLAQKLSEERVSSVQKEMELRRISRVVDDSKRLSGIVCSELERVKRERDELKMKADRAVGTLNRLREERDSLRRSLANAQTMLANVRAKAAREQPRK